MGLQQITYTSWPEDPHGGTSLRLHAASPGLDQARLGQLERSIRCRPSLSDSQDPGPALSFYRLGEAAVVARSILAHPGEADSAAVACFTHALVALDGPGALGPLAPIQLWEAGHWVEQADTISDLPELALPAPNPDLSLERAAAFLRAAPGRLALIGPLMAAMLDCVRRGQRLLMAAPADECAWWIAALTLPLPPALAQACTFSTAIHDPGAVPCHLLGIEPASDGPAGRLTLQPDWYVCEPDKAILTPAPPSSPFARLVETAYSRDNLAELRACRTTAGALRTPLTLDTLDSLAGLYTLRHQEEVEAEELTALTATACALLTEPFPLINLASARSPIEPLLRHLEGRDLGDPVGIRAAWQLYEAARDATSPSAHLTIQWFTDWLGRRVMPEVDAADLQTIADRLTANPLPDVSRPTLATAIGGRLRDECAAIRAWATARTDDRLPGQQRDSQAGRGSPRTLMALISCAEQAGVAQGLRLLIDEALELLVNHAIADPVTAAYVGVRAVDDHATRRHLLEAMTGASHEPGRLERWHEALTSQETRRTLQAEARRIMHMPLFMYLTGLELDPTGNRAARLTDLLQMLLDGFAGTDPELEHLERWWLARLYPGQGPLPHDECAGLLAMYRGALVAETSLFPRVAAGILTQPDLSAPAYRHLVEGLAVAAKRRAGPTDEAADLEMLAAILGRIEHLHRSARRPELEYEELGEATWAMLRRLPVVYSALRSQLTAQALAAMTRGGRIAEPVAALLGPPGEEPGEVWTALAQYAEERGRDFTADQFAELFGILGSRQLRDKRSALEALDAPLRAIWSGLDKTQKRHVERRLRDHQAQAIGAAWRQWCRRGRGRWSWGRQC